MDISDVLEVYHKTDSVLAYRLVVFFKSYSIFTSLLSWDHGLKEIFICLNPLTNFLYVKFTTIETVLFMLFRFIPKISVIFVDHFKLRRKLTSVKKISGFNNIFIIRWTFTTSYSFCRPMIILNP